MITIDVIHVSGNLGTVFFHQFPIGKTGETQVSSAIGIGAAVFSLIIYACFGLFLTLANQSAVTAKHGPTVPIAECWLTTTRVAAKWTLAMYGF